jgi:chromosome segregation ATPase
LPIPKGAKFRIAETEVFHEKCVHLIAQSYRFLLEREVAKLRGELARERGETSLARNQESLLRSDLASSRDRVRDLERQRDDWMKRSNDSQDNAMRLERQRVKAMNERNTALADLDAARRELALHRALGPPTPTQAQQLNDAEKTTDDRNPTEVRFSLIEPHEP